MPQDALKGHYDVQKSPEFCFLLQMRENRRDQILLNDPMNQQIHCSALPWLYNPALCDLWLVWKRTWTDPLSREATVDRRVGGQGNGGETSFVPASFRRTYNTKILKPAS
jgi:hypothetical protein